MAQKTVNTEIASLDTGTVLTVAFLVTSTVCHLRSSRTPRTPLYTVYRWPIQKQHKEMDDNDK